MKRALALAVLLVAPTLHAGQQNQAQPSGLITEASVRGHMEFLASNAMNGRGSGTRDEWIAAEYIASHLRRWGLEPIGDRQGQGRPRSFIQEIDMRSAEATAAPVLQVGSLALTHGKEIVVVSIGTVAKVAGPLVVYKPGVPIAAGAAVLVPETTSADDRFAMAMASLIILPENAQIRQRWDQMAGRMPAGPLRPLGLPPTAGNRATAIAVDKATYAAISKLAAGARVLFDPPLKYSDPSYTWNVVASLTGSDPALRSEIILLSAHLDHVGMNPNAPGDDKIFNGADDDASGCVAVLELARALARGERPKRTFAFAWFGSEERGGHGSQYFAETTPLGGVIANLQFEMIGRPDPKVPPKTLWLTGYERSTLGAELAKHGAPLVADPHPDQMFFQRSDNIRFARKGIPAHTVSSYGLHKDYHKPSDEIDTIDFAHMTGAIVSLLEPIRWLGTTSWKPEWHPGGRPR